MPSVSAAMPRYLPPFLLALVLLAPIQGCGGDDRGLTVAVAANFAGAAEALGEAFEGWTGVPVRFVVGSTGQLYAQIRNGAPVDVFLSADAERPRLLEEEGLAVAGSRFTYAVGRLALYGPRLERPVSSLEDLREGGVVAVADPRVAPYGRAAEEAVRTLGLEEEVAARIVQAESVGQVHRFLASGAAEWGFVALAQVVDEPPEAYLVVPDSLHGAIRQDAVLLTRAGTSPAAEAWMDFLRSAEARQILRERGYDLPGRSP